MIIRRINAYLVDLLLFIAGATSSFYLGTKIAYKLFGKNIWVLDGIVIFPLMLVILFIIFGVASVLCKGSIGKKIFDLKVSPTTGWVTPVRLFIRDIFGKYFVFFPLSFSLFKYIQHPIENASIAYTFVKVTFILMFILAVANGLLYLSRKKLLVDYFFDTLVENDIPTATEYADILEFKNKNKTTNR